MAHFYFRARQDNSMVQLVTQGSPSVTVNLEYSTDETNWSTWYKDTTLSSGQTLYLRGDNPDGFGASDDNYWHFKTTSGRFNIGGDLSYIVSVTGANTIPVNNKCFIKLFSYCTGIVECEETLLSGFTTLKSKCYESMFQGCTSLTIAPTLPATTLAEDCYRNMFVGCSSLTTAPTLPATTLARGCYWSMFQNCTSLTSAPVLSATTLVEACYRNMFNNCTSLNYIKCLATDISASACTYVWTSGVTNSGTFVKSPSMSNWTTGVNGIPTGWNVYDDAPALMTVDVDTITGVTYEGFGADAYLTYVNMVLSSVTATTNVDWIDLSWLDDSTKTQLEIDIDENNTNLSRTATITISGRDYQNQSHTATISVQQVGRPKGAIIVNPTKSVPWTYDGKIYIDVAYSGFTSIGSVNFATGGTGDFIDDIDWQNDETKTELWIEIDNNTGINPRTQTITLTGTDDWDNVITATITVTQAAFNRFPIWQDVYYTGATQTLDYYIVMDNTDTIYQGRAYVQPNQDNVKINISKICQNYLDNDIEDGNEFINGLGFLTYGNNAVRTFRLYNASGDTLLEEYTYFYNWSYNALSNNLVLTTPINGHSDSRMVKVGTEVVLEDDLYLNHTISTLYTNGYCGDYALYYLQRNGGWAAFLIEGNTKKTDSYEKYSYNMAFNNNTAQFEESTYHNQITSSWNLHTGWLTDSQADNLAFNLLASNRVFLHSLKDNKIIPVIISNSEAEYKTFKNNGNHMVRFDISLTESQKKQLL